MKIKHSLLLFVPIISLLFLSNSVLALTVTNNNQIKPFVPRGTTQAPIFRFDVTGNAETFSTLQVDQLAGSTATFGTEISEVLVFMDANGDDTFTGGTDTQIGTSGSLSVGADPVTITLSSQQSLTSTAITIFIVYKISQTASVGTTQDVQLTLINGAASGSTTTRNITITGLTASGNAIATGFFIPGQTDVPMLAFSLGVGGETLNDDLAITVKNDSSTFITTANAKDGVTRVRLFNDVNGNSSYDALDTEIESVIPSSSATIIFNFANPFILSSGTTTNFLVLYDFGASINVESTAKAQILTVTATGGSSALTTQTFTAFPSTAASVSGVGVQVKNTASIVPSSNYGPGSEKIPIFKFSLRGYNTAATINSVTIQNNGTVPYVTTSGGSNGVTKIHLYQDSDGDLSFDGSDQETLISTLTLGSTSANSDKDATLSFNGILVPTYNSNSSNDRTFFVLYDLGIGFSVTSPSTSTASVTVNASTVQGQLTAVTGSIATTTNIGIAGSLPALPVVSVTLKSTSIAYNSLTDISPTSAVQGAYNLPMLKFNLVSNVNVSGLNFSVSNPQGTFSALGTGVSKIILFRDANSSGTLDSSDVVLGSTSTFNSSTEASISNVPLNQGTTTVFLAYNISPMATVGNDVIAAQIKDITGTSVVLAGVTPFPITSAKCSIVASPLSITQVSSTAASITKGDVNLPITLTIANNSGAAVALNEISPRFYQTTIDGGDITSEYVLTATPSISSIPIGTTDLIFLVSAANIRTGGTIILDGFLDYVVGTINARITRYQTTSGGNYSQGAQSTDSWFANVSYTAQPGDLPSQVASMNAGPVGFMSDFQPDDSIPANSQIEVNFINNGNNIDLQTMVVQLNGQTLTEGTDYTVDYANGKVTILNIGNTSGTVKISTKDISGKSLPDVSLNFVVKSSYVLYNFYCFPNPFNPIIGQNNTLRISYQSTQIPSSATIKIYDSSADEIAEINDPAPTLGYNEISWNPVIDGRYIPSGVYILFLEIVAPDGKKYVSKTKLAVGW